MGKASKGLLDDEDVAAQDEDANLSLSINPEYAARLEVMHPAYRCLSV